MPTLTLDQRRRYAIARSLFAPTTLPRAISKPGFVQANPIRAPARAQDLTLRHRVADYRAGDLERRYPRLAIEEDVFVNYGFLPRATHALMHPRVARTRWGPARMRTVHDVLEFVREHGSVHPREVDAHFQHGRVANWFGGTSSATTQLLDGMHYRGMLRIARREGGVRVYAPSKVAPAARVDRAAVALRLDALIDVIVAKYAPLPSRCLGQLVGHLRAGAPQWNDARAAALARAKQRLPKARVDGTHWYWPEGENPASGRHALDDELRLLAPFDPIVWDRMRFEAFWGWAYRFEAYVPAPKRKLGYYALPMLWRGEVIGGGNMAAEDGRLKASFGHVAGDTPKDRAFIDARDAEVARIAAFLDLPR